MPAFANTTTLAAMQKSITQFEVEFVMDSKGERPYIIARHLTPGKPFSLSLQTRLNNIEIESAVTSPRALYTNGEPRYDLYIFRPLSRNDITGFKVNMIIDLTAE